MATDDETQETDGAQRWYDAVLQLARIDDLTRRVERIEAWQRQHDAAQRQTGGE